MKTIILTDNFATADRLRRLLLYENFIISIMRSDQIDSIDKLKELEYGADLVLLFFENKLLYTQMISSKNSDLEIVIILDQLYDFVSDHDLMQKVNSIYVLPLEYRILASDLRRILYQISQKNIIEEVFFDKIKLDMVNRRLCIENKHIDLKNKEFTLMKYFMENHSRVLTKSRILETVWDFNEQINTNTLEVHISNLRKNLRNIGAKCEYIKTIPCVGYQLTDRN